MVEAASKRDGHGKQKMYAEIWSHDLKKKLAWGWNSPDESELSIAYAKSDLAKGTHAEVSAVINALSRHVKIRGGHVVVVRSKKTKRGGELISGLAQPCHGCNKILFDFRIRSVTWTLDQVKGHIGVDTMSVHGHHHLDED